MPTSPILRAVATANPATAVPQTEVKAAALEFFPEYAHDPRFLAVFDHAAIDTRYLAMDRDWYRVPHSFGEKNDAFIEHGTELATRAAEEAIARAGLTPAGIDAIVFVTITGISTPSLESVLIDRLGIDRSAQRVPLWGLGCAAGTAGLALAGDLVRAGRRNVLFVSAELCTLTFVPDDHSRANFISFALFSDGAAAAVVSADGDGPALLGRATTLVADSEEAMGWFVTDAGLVVKLDKSVPVLTRRVAGDAVRETIAREGWATNDVDSWVVHPGGTRVLEAFESSLGIEAKQLDDSYGVLADHGNMSSATVLFVLERALRQGRLGRTVMASFGPGFAAELLCLQD